jgi:hypothetical protein
LATHSPSKAIAGEGLCVPRPLSRFSIQQILHGRGRGRGGQNNSFPIRQKAGHRSLVIVRAQDDTARHAKRTCLGRGNKDGRAYGQWYLCLISRKCFLTPLQKVYYKKNRSYVVDPNVHNLQKHISFNTSNLWQLINQCCQYT